MRHPFFLMQKEDDRKDEFMSRRKLREQIFKLLFRVEFHNVEELPQQLSLCEEDSTEWSEEERGYISQKFHAIVEKLPELDGMINEVSEGWKTGRMGKVDLTLIRLAVYEMKYEEDIPVKVAINEAVELAKKYGTDDSPGFVNGVLAKLA